MTENKTIELGSVQKTLLLPLWGRAAETQRPRPKLVDQTAVKIVHGIDFDFSIIEKNTNPLTRASWIARSVYFDGEIRKYLERFPGGPVVNIGCGFDTTFERVDNGKVLWFDLDLPDVITLRKQYVPETDRRKFIDESVFGKNWYEKIADRENALLMMAGVIYYFKEDEIQGLFREFKKQFKCTDIIFDYSSEKGVEIANRKVIKRGGLDEKSNLVWGTNNIREIVKWDSGITVMHTMGMFKEFRKKYPVTKRMGFILADFLKVMSLCHIRICNTCEDF